MFFIIKMFLSLIAAFFVAGSAILLFNKRYIAAKKAYTKDLLKSYVQTPTNNNSQAVNRLSLKVDTLNNNFHILGENQHEDHKLIINHEHRLDHDKREISWIKVHKADKKKRGNKK